MAAPAATQRPAVPATLTNAIQLTYTAQQRELAGDFSEAHRLHGEVIVNLNHFIAAAQKKSEVRRRAKLHLRAATDRLSILRPCFTPNPTTKKLASPPPPMPSLLTIAQELMDPALKIVPLSMVERGILPSLPSPQTTNVVDPSTGIVTIAASPPAETFLTPLLDASLPDTTYHIYVEYYSRFPNIRWFNYHVKETTKAQTIYTLSASKRPRYQIPSTSMLRASSYDTLCAHVSIDPIRPSGLGESASESTGRALRISPSTGTTIVDAPDRDGRGWMPSRFTYGGRRFVWVDSPSGQFGLPDLFEVKREWGKVGSKTGKREDERFGRKLAWGEAKIAMSKIGTIHMVGGLDQIFREFILASVITRRLVYIHGHD